MDPRERWQALQGRLTAARAAVDAGNTAAALSEITAALELDKDFLAAQALRDRILAANGTPKAPKAPASALRSSASRPLAPPAAVSSAPAIAEPPRTTRPVKALTAASTPVFADTLTPTDPLALPV
jgi:hypothetical protein